MSNAGQRKRWTAPYPSNLLESLICQRLSVCVVSLPTSGLALPRKSTPHPQASHSSNLCTILPLPVCAVVLQPTDYFIQMIPSGQGPFTSLPLGECHPSPPPLPRMDAHSDCWFTRTG